MMENKMYMEDVNKLVCSTLDVLSEFVEIDVATEDMLFDRLQLLLSDVLGVGDYRGYN